MRERFSSSVRILARCQTNHFCPQTQVFLFLFLRAPQTQVIRQARHRSFSPLLEFSSRTNGSFFYLSSSSSFFWVFFLSSSVAVVGLGVTTVLVHLFICPKEKNSSNVSWKKKQFKHKGRFYSIMLTVLSLPSFALKSETLPARRYTNKST